MDCHVQNVYKQSDEKRLPHECHECRLFISTHLVQKSSFTSLICEITQPMKCNLSLDVICDNTSVGKTKTVKIPLALYKGIDVPIIFREIQGKTSHFPLLGIIVCLQNCCTSTSASISFFR